ncbi:MAG: TorF family putative porin [Nitrosomonadales bacterium]|nr:TorF family putative porin [Nitrosomonadales bacterium]
MRKSLLLAAVIGTFAASNVAIAEEAAPAAPESPHSFSYNVGLYSQYIFRGLTQTREDPALQGGVDYSHDSGFYVGMWGSNISWLSDADNGIDGGYRSSSLEIDVYGGYASEIGETGIAYDIGLLQYIYPGSKRPGVKKAETTEVYGSLGYSYFTGKVSVVVSDGAFGLDNADGSYYAEVGVDYPIGDTGLTASLHYGYQDFKGSVQGSSNSDFDYSDWKVGLTKEFDNGVNLGGYYTATNGGKSSFTDASGQHIAKDQFTVFVQKTF